LDKKELKITADGSHTLFVPGLDETYHSRHGAIQESLHVFINAGLRYLNNKNINVLEIGFGTGLNAFLTLLEANKGETTINYTSLEAFPLEMDLVKQLNYTTELEIENNTAELYNKLHEVDWESTQHITNDFKLKKLKIKLDDFESSEKFDVIYFDAFGPNVQPEMWAVPVLEKMYNCLNDNGLLVTYCAKGSVKRGLKDVGFKIESIPGPPGKREMTRAHKI
jgi:tRNA U34 5-methylaminomethyl-2-thiouridine-forming methyltransferase MnmC